MRHHERGISGGDLDALTSVGVLVTPRRDGYREWDTTVLAVTGDPQFTEEELHNSRTLWNTPIGPTPIRHQATSAHARNGSGR
jgi:hypothetical protein